MTAPQIIVSESKAPAQPPKEVIPFTPQPTSVLSEEIKMSEESDRKVTPKVLLRPIRVDTAGKILLRSFSNYFAQVLLGRVRNETGFKGKGMNKEFQKLAMQILQTHLCQFES